jgi:hypothetical protein
VTPEQFCYWLQGRAELMPDTPPTCAEWAMIREHLATVFQKVTPPLQYTGPAVQDPLLRQTTTSSPDWSMPSTLRC